jgi:ABC-type Fe3+/spermidine/putrescine transport system ATPase subunit
VTVTLTGLSLRFGDQAALDNVHLAVASAERFAVMGPSGAGKSTLLRVIAGLDRPDGGTIKLDSVDITKVPAHRRSVGLMFQDYALFPHMSALENVAYGLKMGGLAPVDRRRRGSELLELVGLAGYERRSPDSLSGGEQQRVALARTLAPSPSLVLFDEPLGSVDSGLKATLLSEMRSAIDAVGAMAIYVTHDRSEAEAFADRLAIMREGKVVRVGTPVDIWEDPRTPFVSSFIGHRNVVPGAVFGSDAKTILIPKDAILRSPHGSLSGIVGGCAFNDGLYTVGVVFGDHTLFFDTRERVAEDSEIRFDIDGRLVRELLLDEI